MYKWLVVVVLVAVVAAEFDLSDEAVKAEFTKFATKYGKTYPRPGLTEKRMAIFRRNLERINFLNQLNDGATYGINQFADFTPEEFEALYLNPMEASEVHAPEMQVTPVNDAPTEFDWRTKGAVTRVKNQGSCGSCWAFSTTGNMEGQWFLSAHPMVELSEQQLVDCDREKDQGCQGGLMEDAFKYIIQAGGLESEQDYPYVGYDAKCHFEASKIAAKISSFEFISKDEVVIRDALLSKGPLSVALNAEWLQFYVGGISDPLTCDPKKLNHGVLLAGYGRGKHMGKELDYWLVKNSWGGSWGESGYFRMVRGTGKCGINTYVITSKV